MKKVLITLLVPVILGAVLWTCSKQEKQTEKPAIDESAVAIKLAKVQTVDYSSPVVSSGLISTETESKLSFKVGGIISKIYVKEGEGVVRRWSPTKCHPERRRSRREGPSVSDDLMT